MNTDHFNAATENLNLELETMQQQVVEATATTNNSVANIHPNTNIEESELTTNNSYEYQITSPNLFSNVYINPEEVDLPDSPLQDRDCFYTEDNYAYATSTDTDTDDTDDTDTDDTDADTDIDDTDNDTDVDYIEDIDAEEDTDADADADIDENAVAEENAVADAADVDENAIADENAELSIESGYCSKNDSDTDSSASYQSYGNTDSGEDVHENHNYELAD